MPGYTLQQIKLFLRAAEAMTKARMIETASAVRIGGATSDEFSKAIERLK